MLKTLQIQDYALIDKIFIEFGKGLNIITGETGAGKSILIDAMGLLLGERASTEVVRKGASKSVVEGIFDIDQNPKVKKVLEENDIEYMPELIMRREISLKGSNRCFLNDTPVSLSLIKDVGNLLVDLHGQHEHQSLLRTETHIEMLDDFGSHEKLLGEFQQSYTKLNSLLHELKSLKEKEDLLKEKKELYSFQIREIDAVSPEENEDAKLSDELKILENAEKLLEATNNIYHNLYESETAVYDALVEIRHQLQDLSKIDRSFSDIEGECQSALTFISDISEFVRSYAGKVDLEPERLEEVRERIGAINMLKKKYGGSLENVMSYRAKIGEEYNLAENFADSIKALQEEITRAREACGLSAVKLSKKRNETARSVEADVVKALTYLGITDSVFKVSILQIPADKDSDLFITANGKHYKYNRSGFDEVEFYISTNLGEDPKPLVKVASGGEISRVMLALKTILAKNDQLPLLIFDEIDTGVSGRIAQKVGHTLKTLAEFHQIISITHLPQIAGLADQHYAVEKGVHAERVVSHITKLDREGRIREVAKLMSGEEITEASLKGARELMGIEQE
ncbi:MAG: DNA repair protein RecN [Syntrophomonadaceae bacterium]